MQGSSFTVEKPRKYYVQITHGPKQCKNNRTGHHLKLFCGQLWQNSLSTKCESQWFEILTEYSWVKQSTLNFPECVHDRQKALKAQNKVLYESVCVGGMTLVLKKRAFSQSRKVLYTEQSNYFSYQPFRPILILQLVNLKETIRCFYTHRCLLISKVLLWLTDVVMQRQKPD